MDEKKKRHKSTQEIRSLQQDLAIIDNPFAL